MLSKTTALRDKLEGHYKEVQDYYDHGMQVPDDVILLFSERFDEISGATSSAEVSAL